MGVVQARVADKLPWWQLGDELGKAALHPFARAVRNKAGGCFHETVNIRGSDAHVSEPGKFSLAHGNAAGNLGGVLRNAQLE